MCLDDFRHKYSYTTVKNYVPFTDCFCFCFAQKKLSNPTLLCVTNCPLVNSCITVDHIFEKFISISAT